MFDLTGFQRDCLFVVAGLGPTKGLAIKDELDEYYGEDVNHGRLYPNLDDLAEKGLVRIDEIDGRTNAYEASDRGMRELDARREWEEAVLGGEIR